MNPKTLLRLIVGASALPILAHYWRGWAFEDQRMLWLALVGLLIVGVTK